LALATRSGPAHPGPTGSSATVAEAPDPLAAQSYPDPAGGRAHAVAAAPSVAAAHASISPGAPSLAEVRQQLKEERRLQSAPPAASTAGLVVGLGGAFLP